MVDQILAASLSTGAKTASKIGAKVVCYVGGTLIGYGVSQAVLPAVRKNMDRYMSKKFGEEAWKQAQTTGQFTEEMQSEIDWYNVEVTAMNGLCNAVGAIASAFADTAACKAIDNSNCTTNSNFTIGNRFTI